MARETHPRSSGSPFGLPGMGRGRRAFALRGDPSRGAALEAPTAPHATAPTTRPRKLSGPARFWDGRAIRVALTVAFTISLVVHWFVAPWNLLPPSMEIEFKEVDDPLTIPVDLVADEAPPPPEPAPEPAAAPPEPDPEPTAPKEDKTPKVRDAGPPPIVDAGQDLATDAGPEPVAIVDAGAGGDGGAPTDAGEEDVGALDDGGLVATADAGGAPGSSGPRDPESMFGLTKVVNAGVQNVVLGLNVALIRKHPVGGRMGPIFQQIPQWKDFLKGAQSPVDPIRDTDWILIYGPSLIHTDRDAVLVRYTAPDDVVDQTIASIAKAYDKGGPFDAGVPGVKASLGFADNGQRVFLRPQPKLLVIVPPSHAHEAAVTFRRQTPRGPSPTEAMRLIVRNPTNQIAIPNLKFSSSLTELRLWIVPRADGGADAYVEGDCTDEAAAADSAERLTELLRRQNSLGVRFATRGLLNKAVVVPEGKKIKLHVEASEEQLEALLQLAAAALNANVPPPAHATPSSPPTSSPRE